MQVIRRSKLGEAKYKRDLALTVFLGLCAAGLVVVPVVLVVGGQAGWGAWVLLIFGVAAGGGAVWFGRSALLYVQSERDKDKLQAVLMQLLDGNYIYFRDLVLPGNRSIGEIDGVLLGPHGALVLQVEEQTGEFICEGDTWYKYIGQRRNVEPAVKPLGVATIPDLERKRLTDSPTWQVIRATREVKAWLSVRDLPMVPVEAVVVLARGKVHSSKLPSCPIVELPTIENFLRTKLSPVARVTSSHLIGDNIVEQIAVRLQANN